MPKRIRGASCMNARNLGEEVSGLVNERCVKYKVEAM